MAHTYINPAPRLWRQPRPLYDVFNAPKRKGYNRNWRDVGDWAGHKGVDIASAYGTVLLATADGIVHRAGWLNSGAGYGVEIWHPQLRTLSRLIHMNRNGPTVQRGDTVVQGQIVGAVGSAGLTSYAHVHFEIRKIAFYQENVFAVSQGTPVSPISLGIFVEHQEEIPFEEEEVVTFEVTRRVLRRERPATTKDRDVKDLQSALAVRGFIEYGPNFRGDGSPDGLFGPSTERAVVNFQAFSDIPATGVVDGATHAALAVGVDA